MSLFSISYNDEGFHNEEKRLQNDLIYSMQHGDLWKDIKSWRNTDMYIIMHVHGFACVWLHMCRCVSLVNVGEQRPQIDLWCHPHSLSTFLSQGHLAESGAHPSGLSNWPDCSGNMLSHLMLELQMVVGGPPSSSSFYMCTRDWNCEPHNYIRSILSTKLPLQLQSVISLLL